ncbi:unnamed protein product [Ilex paraguariensis]|uniref:Uncharacterized protein n=1 Tax=Ilex paraguariensis TaxID=185542 RepID=A0ABC8QTU7_9AQUA
MPEELGQIVGLERQQLITKLGCTVQKHAPLQVTKWSKIDKDDWESLLQMAKKMSAQNARNQAMQNTPHLTTTNSFTRNGVEMEQMVELQSQPIGQNEAPICEEEIYS